MLLRIAISYTSVESTALTLFPTTYSRRSAGTKWNDKKKKQRNYKWTLNLTRSKVHARSRCILDNSKPSLAMYTNALQPLKFQLYENDFAMLHRYDKTCSNCNKTFVKMLHHWKKIMRKLYFCEIRSTFKTSFATFVMTVSNRLLRSNGFITMSHFSVWRN